MFYGNGERGNHLPQGLLRAIIASFAQEVERVVVYLASEFDSSLWSIKTYKPTYI